MGYALLVLFFVMGVVKTCGSFAEMKKPEVAFKCFIRFVLAQAAVIVGHGADDRRLSCCPGHGGDHHGFLRADGDVSHGITG